MPNKQLQQLLSQIKSGQLDSWDAIHDFYANASSKYNVNKKSHALTVLEQIKNQKFSTITKKTLLSWLDEYLAIKTDINRRIKITRTKDYTNPFRKMVFENEAEMNAVIGSLESNSFIKDQKALLEAITNNVELIKKALAK
jgi:hypothetical protein